jgi:hypothetical protein
MNRTDFALKLANLISPARLTAVTDDARGWRALGAATHDRPLAEQQAAYQETLSAWRKNPLAWRIIQITTDYTVGEGIGLSSRDPAMQRFIDAFWHDPQNHLPLRLAGMSEELARAGDLFPVLFRRPSDGVSLLRFITKDQVGEIETAAGDWERETAVIQHDADPTNPRRWPTPAAGAAARRARAVALHYHINRPLGAAFGESDLATVLPWLLRYSRLLEDRVRLHWAARMFLWFVQVPRHRVGEKAEQYKVPPESGSVIVHDESESWSAVAPVLRGADVAPDLKAVRNMIDAGSGYPPHWRGEAADVNLATAQAMQEPAERHLARRQAYFAWLLQDLTYQAYERARALRPELWPEVNGRDYRSLFLVTLPDVSRSDNLVLAQAAANLSAAFERLQAQYPASPTLRRLLLKLVLRFVGEGQGDEVLDRIMGEVG